MPRILENDAYSLAQSLETMDETQRAQALDILTRYRDQQSDLGEPQWPKQEKAAQDYTNRLRGMFKDIKTVDSVAPSLTAILPYSQNPDADRARVANTAYMAQRYGKAPEEISASYELWRDDYATRFLQSPAGLDDLGFHKAAAQEIQKAELKEGAELDGIKAAFRGDDVIPALQAWQAKNTDRLPDSTEFTRGFLKARETSGDHLEFAEKLLKQIESNTGLTKGEGEQRPKAASRESAAEFEQSMAALADMKPKDRKQVYAIIGAKAEAAGYDPKGFWSQMLSEFGKGMARAGDTVSTSGADLLAGGSMVGGDAAGGFAPVPADSQERFQQGMEARGKRGVIFAEIENLVAGTVDPVKPVLGWMNDTVEKGLIKGPGAVAPFMAASVALGPYGAGVLFTADFAEQNRRDLVISGMDEGQARVIGMAAAPLQAVTESLSNALQLGRFPAVQKVLAGFTKPIGGGAGLITRYVQNSAISLGTEFTEEQLQDNFIVPATQELLGALQTDVPEVDWSMYHNRAIESTPELLSVLAPMALVFGGTMTAAQANLSAVAISSQDMLEAAGFSSAQANTIRSETAPDAQIAKARELWGQRAGTAKSIEDAAKSVGERMKQLQTDHMAAQLDMERRGILPRMLRSSEDNWRLTFSDGSTADFHTHQDADAARWQWATDQLGKVHLATREALAQMEKNAAVGREFAVEFKPDAMTAKQAVEEGRASPAQIERRIAQGEAAGEVSEEETFSNAASIDKATSDYLSSLQILGSSANEFKDGVLRTTIRLYEGAHVLTLVEEKLEGDAKQILASKPGREWMLRSLRNYEQISGDSILRKVPDSELTQDDLIEAWSSLGQSYLVGKSKKGAAIGKGGARRIFADVLKAGMGGAMNSETQFFNAVWRRAAKLSKLKREGKLGEDLTAELERQLGIDSQTAHETAVADGVAREVASYSEENPGPNGETFSTSRATPADSSKVVQMPDGARLVGPTTFSIRAYHGTPHKVDRFSLDKIGTGEGAQAYGWGLYFAQNQEVAQGYQSRIAGAQWVDKNGRIRTALDIGEAVYEQARKDGYSVKDADELRSYWSAYAQNGGMQNTQGIESIRAVVDGQGIKLKRSGNLYTVELLPDADEFLDWDKPLSEQSEKVRKAVGPLIHSRDTVKEREVAFAEYDAGTISKLELSKRLEEIPTRSIQQSDTGAAIYQRLWSSQTTNGREASEFLASIGIPGIRYLDGQSRDGGSGTSNFVIFDESLVKILEENGKPVGETFSMTNEPSPGGLSEAGPFTLVQASALPEGRFGTILRKLNLPAFLPHDEGNWWQNMVAAAQSVFPGVEVPQVAMQVWERLSNYAVQDQAAIEKAWRNEEWIKESGGTIGRLHQAIKDAKELQQLMVATGRAKGFIASKWQETMGRLLSYDGPVYRGEATPPTVVKIQFLRDVEMPREGAYRGHSSSGLSNSFYPRIAAVLSNGAVVSERIRISDHPQVSENAPRRYDIDLRATEQQLKKKAFRQVVEEQEDRVVRLLNDLVAESWDGDRWTAQKSQSTPQSGRNMLGSGSSKTGNGDFPLSAPEVNPESSRAADGTFSLRKFPLPPGLAEAAQKARGESSLILAYQATQRGSSSAMVPIRSVYEQAKKYQPALTPAAFMAQINALNESGSVLIGLSETTKAVEEAGAFRVGAAGTEMAFAPQETFSLAEPSPVGLSEAEAKQAGLVGPLYRGFHKSNSDIRSSPIRGGTHFTTDEEYAATYADESGGVMKVFSNPGQRVMDLTSIRNKQDLLERFSSAGVDVDSLKYDPSPWSQDINAHTEKSIREIIDELSQDRSDWSDFSPNEEITDALTFSGKTPDYLDSIKFEEHGTKGHEAWIIMRPGQVFEQKPDGKYYQISPESSRAAGGTLAMGKPASITPAQDAEYMAAVESGDVAKQQAMVDAAAKAAGYNVGPVYHGTEQKGLTEFYGGWWSDTKKVTREFGSQRYSAYLKGPLADGDTLRELYKKFNGTDIDADSDGSLADSEIADVAMSGGPFSRYVEDAGYQGIEVWDESNAETGMAYSVFNPNQIKSADPVTRDAEGNVIPLSQRFNPERNEITFSLRSGDFASRMAAAFSPFQRNPELRLAIAQVAKARAQKIGAEWIEKAAVIRDASNIEAERKSRYTLALNDLLGAKGMTLDDVERSKDQKDYETWQRFQESKDLLMKSGMTEEEAVPLAAASSKKWRSNIVKNVKESMAQAKAGADEWAEGAKKKAGSPKAQREALKAALRTLDGILSAAPPEVRAKVGGYIKLAGLATDEAMLQEIERRIAKLNVELEKWLKKEGVAEIQKLLKRGRPDAKSGKRGKGKDADMHALFAAAERAIPMTAEAVAGELARLDALIGGDALTPEQEALAITERGIVELAGDLKSADSGRVFSALDSLREIYEGGWLKWKLAQIEKREERAGMRGDFIADTGKSGVKPERDAADKAAVTLLGKIKGGFLSLSSFHEVLAYAFGSKSDRVKALVDAEREASGQYEDVTQSLADEVESLFSELAGGSVLAGERLRFDMSQRTIQTGKGDLSQLEAIQALLMWRQEDGRRHMEGAMDENGKPIGPWNYDQAWIDEITAALTPEARSVMAWLSQKYAAEHPALNALYRERYGVNMPAHDNYAPITVQPVQTKSGEVNDPVSGAAISSGSVLVPGSLRARSRSAIAEPDFRDSLQTFMAHTRQLEYWKAYYDLAFEASAILGNREVLNAVKAKGGEPAATALRKWIDAIAQGGFRDASATLGLHKLLSRMTGRAASVGLLGRFSTLLVQSTQLGAASVKMPVGAYLVRLSKLLTGNLSFRDAVNSPFIQRRYKSAPPIVRQALEGLGVAFRPNQITRATRHLGNLLSGADAMFTAGTYAMLLDYHRGTGQALGLSGAELETHAHTEAERDTEAVAQPTRMATRSLAELTSTNPLAKVSWAYASEARQKIALMAWATMKATAEPAQFAKTAFLVFGVGGLMTQILKNLWREAKGDDDEKKWSPERLALSAMAGPLHGVPLASELMGNQGMLSGVAWAWPALKDIASGEGDMRDIDILLSAAGLFNDTAAGIASLSHVGLDAAKLLTNLASEK